MTALALLYEPPTVGMTECMVVEANQLLERWGHPLGACRRPFHQEAHMLVVHGEPVAVTMSASTVSPTIDVHSRGEVVELARICRHPDVRWVLRPALRIWREVFGPAWRGWPVVAAYSYSLPGTEGDIYRFDGWEKVKTVGKAGAGKSSTWSNPSVADEIGDGKKTMWRFKFETPKQLDSDTRAVASSQLASGDPKGGE